VSAWAWLVVATVIVLVAAELGARWWIRRRTRYHVWLPGLRLDLRQVPDVFRQVEPSVRFEVNADGERAGDVRGDDPGLVRVLVAGGSAVECLSLDQPTSWPGALERLLNTNASRRRLAAERVHVGNIGRSGIASRDLDLILERVLPQYGRLSVVVIMVGASDVLLWLEDGAPPMLDSAPIGVGETFACHPEARFGWLPSRWAGLELARRMRRVWLRPVQVRERAGAWVPAARKMRAQATELRTSVPDPGPVLDRFDHHFRRLLRRAQAHADRVLVLRQPWFDKEPTAAEAAQFWHGGVGKAWKEPISVYYTLDVLHNLMGLVDARAAAVAEELVIEHVDLRQVLTPSLENYCDYFHFTPAGAALIARTVAAILLRAAAPSTPLPAADASSFTVTSVTCISSMPPTR
jgi:lysophospholipase L1-like esterase